MIEDLIKDIKKLFNHTVDPAELSAHESHGVRIVHHAASARTYFIGRHHAAQPGTHEVKKTIKSMGSFFRQLNYTTSYSGSEGTYGVVVNPRNYKGEKQ